MNEVNYVVVRYNADPGRGELLNIGVIAWVGHEYELQVDNDALSRVVRENPLLDRDALRYVRGHLDQELRKMETFDPPEMLGWLSETGRFPISFTEPRSAWLDVGAGETLQTLAAAITQRTIRVRRRGGGGDKSPRQVLRQHFAPLIRSQSAQLCDPDCWASNVTMLTFPPVVHRADPNTSLHAAVDHTKSGAREHNIQRVLAWVQAEPGLTGYEYGKLSGLGEYEARRRLSDLKAMHRVFREGTRVVDGKKPASRWWPVLRQGALL